MPTSEVQTCLTCGKPANADLCPSCYYTRSEEKKRVANIPTHVVSIIAKERWSTSENVYYTAYRAVCTCPWKGAHHRVDEKDPKRARHYAEKDGERHYDLHRNYQQLSAESTDD